MTDLVAEMMGQKVATLKAAMLQQTPEQIQAFLDSVEMSHYQIEGIYCRKAFRKAGVTIVGKVHKKEHFYIVAKGEVMVTNGDFAPVRLPAGSVIVSKPGTERAVFALEDSVCLTIHRTDKTDLDEIEEELIEPDPTALFDARNKLKELK